MAAFILNVFVLLCALASLGDASPKVFSMRMYRNERSILRKRSPLPVNIGNAITNGLYFVNASVGTPPQTVQLQIDTGSSDVWMFGPHSCNASTSPCLGGEFDPSQSSSLTVIAQGTFNISYVTPNSGVTGDYVADNFAIGGTTIKNLTMAVASNAAFVPTGIMGIGFDTDESIVSSGAKPYPNIIDVLVQEKIINTRAYSLWLDDLVDSTGTVLFGGYDSAKYSGQLSLLQIYPDAQSGTISSMTVAWTSLSVTDSSGTTQLSSSDFPLPAVLDSGTTLTIVPPDLFSPLANYFGVISDPTYGILVTCSIGSLTGSLDYGFGGSGGPIISVSFAELAVPIFDNQGNPLTFQDGSPACAFGLAPASQGEPILFGDTFLRSAYVVYDLDSQQIGIAPTVFNTSSSNIVEIGPGNVAGASSIATGPSVEQTATANLPPGLFASGSATASLIRTTVQTGHVGSITGVGTTKPVTTVSATASTSPPTATATKNTAPIISPAFDIKGVLVVGSSFVMMLLGGAFIIFN